MRWKYRVDKGVATDVLRIGSRLYAVASGTDLLCFDLKTGRLHWDVVDAPPAAKVSKDHRSGTDVAEDHRSRTSDGSERDADDPDTLPSDQPPGPTSVSPMVVGSHVYFATSRGNVYAVNARTGKVAWKTILPAPITTDLAGTSGFLYAGTAAGHLYRLRLSDGTVAGDLETQGRPFGNQVVLGSSLFVLLGETVECCDSVAAVDLTLKRVLWRQKPPMDRHGRRGKWTTFRPRLWKGMVLAGTDQGVLAALRPSDGSWFWSHTFEGRMRGIGHDEQGVFYVGNVEGTVYAFRPDQTFGAPRKP